MGTLNRIRQIIASNVNALLEKAEDPATRINQLIREMDESIIRLRMEVAKGIAAEKRLTRRREEADKALQKSDTAARSAVAAGNEGAARKAVARKLDAAAAEADLTEQQQVAAEMTTTLKAELRRLEDKIQEVRRKKESLIAHKRKAQAEQAMLEATEQARQVERRTDAALNGERADVTQPPASLAEEVTDLEAENEARRRMAERDRSLEEQMDEAQREAAIEKELDAIRKELRKC